MMETVRRPWTSMEEPYETNFSQSAFPAAGPLPAGGPDRFPRPGLRGHGGRPHRHGYAPEPGDPALHQRLLEHHQLRLPDGEPDYIHPQRQRDPHRHLRRGPDGPELRFQYRQGPGGTGLPGGGGDQRGFLQREQRPAHRRRGHPGAAPLQRRGLSRHRLPRRRHRHPGQARHHHERPLHRPGRRRRAPL